MQITIELDADTMCQLEAIQQHTNQDLIAVIQQGIGLYHQQLQPHRQFFIEVKKQLELVSKVSASVSVN